MLTEADMASVFHQILEEQHKGLDQRGWLSGSNKHHRRDKSKKCICSTKESIPQTLKWHILTLRSQVITWIFLSVYWLALKFPPDDFAYNRISRPISRLSFSSCGSGSFWGPRRSSNSYVPGHDDSEYDDDRSQSYQLYQSHPGPLRQTSQESLNSSNPPPQVFNIIYTLFTTIKSVFTSSFDDRQVIRPQNKARIHCAVFNPGSMQGRVSA